jgi:putative sterol carrier protein
LGYPFPSVEWLQALVEVLNTDTRYAEVAKNWEGDMLVIIEPDDVDDDHDLPKTFYLDLWHGKCREGRLVDENSEEVPEAAFILSSPLSNIVRIFQGELDPMQAMITRRLKVQGSMAYMLRNVPTVLDFVRCCRLVEIDSLV